MFAEHVNRRVTGKYRKNNVISVHIVVYAKCSSFGKSRKGNANLILPYILGAREEGMEENLYSEDTVTYGKHSRHFDLAMAGIDQSLFDCLRGNNVILFLPLFKLIPGLNTPPMGRLLRGLSPGVKRREPRSSGLSSVSMCVRLNIHPLPPKA